MFTSRSTPRSRGGGGTARCAARVGDDIGDATFAFSPPATPPSAPSPMIDRLDTAQRNAAGLVAVVRAVAAVDVRRVVRDRADDRTTGWRMPVSPVTKSFRGHQPRHIPGAGPAAGAHAR